jgi:virulence-associated protein VagC
MSLLFEGAPPPVTPQDGSTDQLAGVLVALDLQRVSIRRDGDRLIARPAEGQQLDAETRSLLADAKPALLEHLALSESERRVALCAAYESVLWEVGRQVQAGQVPLQGWLAALAKYEALSAGSLA